ncbi:hypothetical protein [Synechococcus sp. CBW1004]|uniref:hypothetical protein n=1 Tax=Synechococcus sp. CBW1004 TaxID=1353136 RepID=UPI0018CD6609|nr:hypothetical protein [Synechococcus sp. CBW1004]QPN62536.1 hypothetical protein H8F25_12650 [Synechococcus sp. CBW1004]
MATATELQVLYITYFGRAADPEGLQYWLINGATQEQIADGFATTPEYADTIQGKTISQVINDFYLNLFGKNADEDGLSFWTGKVNDFLNGVPGGASLQQVGRLIADGALVKPAGDPDRVILESKIAAAGNWTEAVASDATFNTNYNGALANTFGVEFLNQVVSPATIPSEAQTLAAVAAIPPFGTIGLLTPLSATVSEGGSVIFQLTTIPATPSTTYTYEISGAVNAADFVSGSLTGVVTTDSTGVGTLQITIANDALVESSEIFSVNIQDIATTSSVTILNTTVPVVSVVAQPTAVSEGGLLTFNIATSAVAPGTLLNYAITGIQAEDVLGGATVLSGTRVVAADGSVDPVLITIATDLLFGEQETATITVSGQGLVSASASAEVVDTTLPPELTVVAQPSAVNEGAQLIFNIGTTSIAAGTNISYIITGIQPADVLGGAAVLIGTRTVNADGSVAPVQITIANDLAFGEVETATITVAGAGLIATASAEVVDTTPEPVLSVVAQPSAVNEGASLAFNISTTSIAPGTLITYTITGIQADDVLGGAAALSGTRTVALDGSVAPVQITIANDLVFGEVETATITVAGAGLIATASAEVVDTTPEPVLSVVAQPSAVNEGALLTFNISTTSIAPGTLITYTIAGLQPSDVLGGLAALSGSRLVAIDGSVAPVQITIAEDLAFGEQETATITIVGAGLTATASAEVVDTTLEPALSVVAQPSAVNEGSVLTFTIATTSVAPGTVLNYGISGIQPADVLGGLAVLSGSRVVNADGSVSPVQITIANDLLFGEDETATIIVEGAGLIASASAQVVDTTPEPALSVVAQPTAVNEGSVLTYIISTTSVASGTVLNYTISGINDSDVLGGAAVLTGTRVVNVDGTVAPVQITISTDLIVGEQETATITVTGAGLTASASAQIVDTSSNVLNLTVNQDIFVESGIPQDLIFSAAVVPGGALGVGFNTLQSFDSLVGGSGQDQLIAGLTSLLGVVVEPLAIRDIETVSLTSLNAANTLSLLNSNSVGTLENFSSTSALTFSNIPGQPVPGGLPTVNINGVYLPGASTTLQFQPVALAGIETLNINTSSSGVNVNGGSGAPLRIITGPGIESAVITDAIQVPDFQVDYDLSQLNIPSISISSPNNVRLSTTGGPLGVNGVNLNTTSINGSGIDGVFTVNLSGQNAQVSIQGGAGDDRIQGRQGNSTLVGNGGNDSLTTVGGNDSLNGGIGNDTLVGAAGNNNFIGGIGNDSISADGGNDSASGDEGNDTINLSGGNNTATGGSGFDSIITLGGSDSISGGDNADTISSGAGSDTVNGDQGDDSIDFGEGLDRVSGGLGDDYFVGNLSPGLAFGTTDTINGDEGVNTLEITATNADAVANSLGMGFVDNIQILNISETVGAGAGSNQVDASLIDSSIEEMNLFNGTGMTPAVFTFNPGSSRFNLETGVFGGDASFNVGGLGTNDDSLTITGPGLGNYLNGKNLTFLGFDGNSVTVNTGLTDQTIGTLTTTPSPLEESRFVFQGAGGVTINQVDATAGNLVLDFNGIGGIPQRRAVVNGTDVVAGSTVSILGSAGSDVFVGDTEQANTVASQSGNDEVTVGSGNDVVVSGIDDDTITPGLGFDNVDAGADDDRLNVGETLNRNSAGDLGFGFDTLDGGSGVDTIQLLGLLGDTSFPLVATQGYTASDLNRVSNFEVLELDVVDSSLPGVITVQDLFNFTVNGNTIETVNLTESSEDLGSALLFNAPTSLVNLGVLETLDNVTVLRRLDTANDVLNVSLRDGADLTTLDLDDEETINFFISGNTTIDTLFAQDLTTLTVSGFGSFTITNPIVGSTQLATLDLSGFSVTTISLDASVSTVDMTVTGPTGLPGTLQSYQLNLVTGSGNDNINATGFGANTIDSNAGNDTIQTGDLADLLTAGLGNDSVSSGGGNDTVNADEGNDTVDAGAGNDVVFGDLGNIAGNDSLFGGLGADTLSGGLGADTIDGGLGIDTYASGFTVSFVPPFVQDPANTGQILGQVVNLSSVNLNETYITNITGYSVAASLQFVAAGTANYLYNLPLPLFGGSPVTDVLANIENVDGTNGNDFIIGSGDINTPVGERDTAATQNRLDGLAGDDTYQGGFGADTFINSDGADLILDLGLIASGGYEQILLDEGATFTAFLGDDWDAGTGVPGSNSVNNGEFTLNLQGFNADLSNSEGDGLYIVNGTAADELVIGSNNGDIINGLGGNDTLIGLGGDDTIFGGAGNDSIEGSVSVQGSGHPSASVNLRSLL